MKKENKEELIELIVKFIEWLIKVLGQSKEEAVKAAASKFNLSEAEIRRSLR